MNEKKYTFMVDSEKLIAIIEKKMKELDEKVNDFQLNHLQFKIDKAGNKINDTNPFLVSTYFFKTINPMDNVEPIYTSEQLGAVYKLYNDIVERVNMDIMMFQPTLSHFAKFAGLSLEKLNSLKFSTDATMASLVERINSDIFDANMTLAQHKRVTNNSTVYRMKVENEKIEKKAPNVNVSVKAKGIDLDDMSRRLVEIRALSGKGRKVKAENEEKIN